MRCGNCNGTGRLRVPIDFRGPNSPTVQCPICKGNQTEDLVYRLRKRAEIRRSIKTRKSVQEGKPDRLADLLDEAADEIDFLRKKIKRNEQHSGY